jgi:hypothetical protein
VIGGLSWSGPGSGLGWLARVVSSTSGRKPLSVANRAAPLLIKVVAMGPVRPSRVNPMAAMLG